jgi:hypothetical protein
LRTATIALAIDNAPGPTAAMISVLEIPWPDAGAGAGAHSRGREERSTRRATIAEAEEVPVQREQARPR